MSPFNRLHRALFFSLALFFCLPNLWSRHIVGGDMSYTYLGDSPAGDKQYRFTLNLYRDCNSGGAGFDNPAIVAVYRGSWSNTVFVTKITVSSPQITNLVTVSSCFGNPPNLCLEQGAYTFDQTLPLAPGESYFLVYQRCCHTETLSNIIDPGNIGSTVMVELTPEAMLLNNSSPVLPPYPIVALCAHHPVHIAQTATDADNDQVSYTFSAPYTGGGAMLNPPQVNSCDGAVPDPPCAPPYAPAPYVVPQYSPEYPITGDPVVEMNPDSGIITGTPNTIGRFLAGISFLEYRNGMLLSTTRREITFTVFDENVTAAKDVLASGAIFQLTPNPAQEWVSWPAALDIVDIQCFDVLGIQSSVSRLDNKLNISGLKPGYYRVLATTSNGGIRSAPLVVSW